MQVKFKCEYRSLNTAIDIKEGEVLTIKCIDSSGHISFIESDTHISVSIYKLICIEVKPAELSAKVVINNIPYNTIMLEFHTNCPSLPKVRAITDARKKLIKARWMESEENQSTAFWVELFKTVEESDFLSGRCGAWTACSFDWIIKSANFIKILEGNYKNRIKAPTVDQASVNDIIEIHQQGLADKELPFK